MSPCDWKPDAGWPVNGRPPLGWLIGMAPGTEKD